MIEPARGMVAEFDNNEDEIQRIERDLDSLLREYRRRFGASLDYYHPGVSKEQYQIPVPVAQIRQIPDSWRYGNTASYRQ